MVRCPFTHQVYQRTYETKQRETAGCAYNTGSGNTQTLVGTDQSLGSTDDKVKHASEQTNSANNTANQTQASAHLEVKVEATAAAEVSPDLPLNVAAYPSRRSVNIVYPVHGSSRTM